MTRVAVPEMKRFNYADSLATWIKYLEKQTARQGKNAQTGTYDFTWMWEELGVGHLRK